MNQDFDLAGKHRASFVADMRFLWQGKKTFLILLILIVGGIYAYQVHLEKRIVECHRIVRDISASAKEREQAFLYLLQRGEKKFDSLHLNEVNLNGEDLRELHIENSSFNRAKLRGANLHSTKFLKVDLRGSIMERATLELTSFKFCQLDDIKWEGASLKRVVFPKNLPRSNFRAVDIEHIYFVKADLRQATFADSRLHWVSFEDANLAGVSFKNSTLTGSRMLGTQLEGADFTDADASASYFDRASLRYVNFTNTALWRSSFIRANLLGADLSGAKIGYCNFSEANLKHCNVTPEMLSTVHSLRNVYGITPEVFSKLEKLSYEKNLLGWWRGEDRSEIVWLRKKTSEDLLLFSKNSFKHGYLDSCDLPGIQLEAVDLSECYLENANLVGANLEKANLEMASLASAQLKEVNFQHANLKRVDLRGADLTGADLSGADLEGAYLKDCNVTADQLLATKSLRNVYGLNVELLNLIAGKNKSLMSWWQGETRDQRAWVVGHDLSAGDKKRGRKTRSVSRRKKPRSRSNERYSYYWKCQLMKLRWEKKDATAAHFSYSDLSRMNLKESTLIDTNFSSSCLVGVDLRKANLKGANFQQANLERANLSGCTNLTVEQICQAASIKNVYGLTPEFLTKVKEASLDRPSFMEWWQGEDRTNLFWYGHYSTKRRGSGKIIGLIPSKRRHQTKTESRNFRGGYFYGGSLISRDFSGLDLEGADFGSATLYYSSFDGADLSGVNFKMAELGSTSFFHCKNLTVGQICEAKEIQGIQGLDADFLRKVKEKTRHRPQFMKWWREQN